MRLRPAKHGRDPDNLLKKVAPPPPPGHDAMLQPPPALPSLPPPALEPRSALASPPPSPTESSPVPRPPIEAYCLPFWDEKGSGCYLLVRQATPGASLTIEFSSAIGETTGERVIQLMPDSSTAFRRVYWKNPSHRQVKLHGLIRYTDDAHRRFYTINDYAQDDRSCDFHVYMPHTKELAVRCTTTVELPDGGVDTVVTYNTIADWNEHFLYKYD